MPSRRRRPAGCRRPPRLEVDDLEPRPRLESPGFRFRVVIASISRGARPTHDLDGGCRINPRRARWIVSKGGLRKRPSRPSQAEGSSPRRLARRPWRVLPRACSSISETALCDSLIDLPARDRPRGDHHGRAHPPRADDVGQRRTAAPTTPEHSGSAHRRSRSAQAKRAPAHLSSRGSILVRGGRLGRGDLRSRFRRRAALSTCPGPARAAMPPANCLVPVDRSAMSSSCAPGPGTLPGRR